MYNYTYKPFNDYNWYNKQPISLQYLIEIVKK